MKYCIYLVLLIFGISSCTTVDESKLEFDLTTVYNQINFEKSKVGQVSTYIHFEGLDFGLSTSALNYTADTLKVTLTAVSGGIYTFQERLTLGSNVFNELEPYIEDHDIQKTSTWKIVSDSLVWQNGTSFLYWPGRESLPFTLQGDAVQKSLIEWGTSNNSFGDPFSISMGEINDFDYDDMNGAYDITDTFVDGEGYEIIYNRPYGILRTSQFGAESLDGFGWDLQLGN